MKTFTTILLMSIAVSAYMLYGAIYNPALPMPTLLVEGVNGSPPLIFGICTFDQLIELIKVLSPLLAPIIAFRYRRKMDPMVNKVVRDKLGIADRRKEKRN
jgi:hypothetical protein